MGRFAMGGRRPLVEVVAVLTLALAGLSASTGFAYQPNVVGANAFDSHGIPRDLLQVPALPVGSLSATGRDHRPPLSKLLAALLLALAVVVPVLASGRRHIPAVVEQMPGPAIRRRGPPTRCISASS